MERIIDTSSCQTYVQQRIRYANARIADPTYFLENVPQWPGETHPPITSGSAAETSYADCQGDRGLVQAIGAYESSKYPIDLGPEHVLVTNGGLHALSLIFRAHYSPGASALCQAPVLRSIADLLRDCGYAIRFFEADPDDPCPEGALGAALDDARLRLIYLNSPNNPTGVVLPRNLTERLVDVACSRGIALVADLVYDAFVFGSALVANPLSLSTRWEQLYAVNSMSKGFGAPGLRIGWIASDPRNIERLAGRLETECVAVCGNAQVRAEALLRGGNVPLVQRVRDNWASFGETVRETLNPRFRLPDGGTQLFVELPVNDVEAFADFLLSRYGVLVATAGNYEGCPRPCIRIPLGYPRDTTARAIQQIHTAMTHWSGIDAVA